MNNCRRKITQYAKSLYSEQVMVQRYIEKYDENGYKKRILLIDVNYKFSSTGKIVHSLYKELQKRGREVAVCYGRGKLVEGKDIYKFGLDWETILHAGLMRITGYNGCFSYFSTKRLINYIETFQPDIIHIHELHAYFVNHRNLLSYIREKAIPLVWTFHCEYMYTGKCGHADSCLNFCNGCGKCPAIREYPKSLFFDKTKEMLKEKIDLLKDFEFKIVTPSQWLADRVKLSFLKNKNISIVYNGVDTNVFFPRDTVELRGKLHIKKKQKVILFVSPDLGDKRKGAQWIIELARRMICDDYVFVLIGAGKISYKNSNNVILIGRITDQNLMAQYYSMADVFVLCSVKETYSMTCAEALCCGTPVAGFCSGAPEGIFHEPYARFVRYGDVEGLLGVINEQIKLQGTLSY